MKKLIAIAVLALAVTGCAITGAAFGPTPEAQIQTGAQAVTAATVLATTLLKNDRITVAQARGYRAILGSASGHLDQANMVLLDCRKKTGSTRETKPDPCAPTIAADIGLAVSVIGEVQRALAGRQ